MNKELRQSYLDQADRCAKGHAEFQRKWKALGMSSAICALIFSIVGTVSATIGVPALFFSQIPVVAWFILQTRRYEKERIKSGKEWLEMRQFRLEMADQFR